MSGSHRHVVIGVYWLCRLFHDVPATSARFSHLDPRDRSHAPPCQSAAGRVRGRRRTVDCTGQQRPSGTLTRQRLPLIVLVPVLCTTMSGSLFLMMLPRTTLPVAWVPASPGKMPRPAC